jgi:hypothetical protein
LSKDNGVKLIRWLGICCTQHGYRTHHPHIPMVAKLESCWCCTRPCTDVCVCNNNKNANKLIICSQASPSSSNPNLSSLPPLSHPTLPARTRPSCAVCLRTAEYRSSAVVRGRMVLACMAWSEALVCFICDNTPHSYSL